MTGIISRPDEGAKVLLEIMKAGSQARTEIEYKDLVKLSEFQEAALCPPARHPGLPPGFCLNPGLAEFILARVNKKR